MRGVARLDLSRTASPDEVRDAYRARVQQIHPDRGGLQAEFERLQKAYATVRERAVD